MLKNCYPLAPLAILQALANDVCRHMLGRFVFVYLDDILMFSRTIGEHIQHMP